MPKWQGEARPSGYSRGQSALDIGYRRSKFRICVLALRWDLFQAPSRSAVLAERGQHCGILVAKQRLLYNNGPTAHLVQNSMKLCELASIVTEEKEQCPPLKLQKKAHTALSPWEWSAPCG